MVPGLFQGAKKSIPAYQVQDANTAIREIISVGDIFSALIMIPALVSHRSYHDLYDALQIKEEGRYRVWDKFFTTLIFLGCQIGRKLKMVSTEHQNYVSKKQADSIKRTDGENLTGAKQSFGLNNCDLVEQSIFLNDSLNAEEANRLSLPKVVKDIQESSVFSRFSIGHRKAVQSIISSEGVVDRVFQGNNLQYRSFLEALNSNLPRNTSVYIRGSSITGFKWRTGQIFDHRGFASSDLDIVFSGSTILEMWNSDNFKIQKHYTLSLGKETPQAAIQLGLLQKQLESITHREVNIQAASDIYLSLRLFLQNISYLKLLQK